MKKWMLGFALIVSVSLPGLSHAKGVPLFFQTGDELFEIEGAPVFEDGYSVGYACQRLGLFGADIWTWDCDIMAISIEEFSVGELDPEFKHEMEAEFSLSDRRRGAWNHYGGFALAGLLVGGIALRKRK